MNKIKTYFSEVGNACVLLSKDLWLQMDGIAMKCSFSQWASDNFGRVPNVFYLGISKPIQISLQNLNDIDFRS